jgi:hypothetical protein
MTQSTRTFRIFVSSTFSDLKAERNAMQAHVFPRLRELCEQHGARFQPIDLRWGVSDEASLDQQAMNICLGEIERCRQISPRPNFIVLLGDRYGWMPPPAQIPEVEYQQILGVITDHDRAFLSEWYKLDENAIPPERRLKPRQKGGLHERYEDWQPVESRLQRILANAVDDLRFSDERRLAYTASATHQEINAGALQQKDAPEHVFCFFRQIQDLPNAFSMPAFQAILTTRLKEEYSHELSSSCKVLVNDIKALSPNSSARDVSIHLKDALDRTPKDTDEKALLEFIQRVLVDISAKDFINLDEDTWMVDKGAYQSLEKLKARLQSEFKHNSYIVDHAQWRGHSLTSPTEAYSLITTDHIGTLPAQLKECKSLLETGYQPQNLCEALFRSLANVILTEFDSPHEVDTEEEKTTHLLLYEVLDEVDVEGPAHQKFAEERLKFFVGRTKMLAKIAAYLQESQKPDQYFEGTGGGGAKLIHRVEGLRRSLVIVGAGGTGKSALLAKAIQDTQKTYPKAVIVYRFIGATPASSGGRGLLSSLCHEISRRYNADDSNIPLDYRSLVPELGQRMQLACENKPLILFLDSLDQLSADQDARSLVWLPDKLPEYVSVVVSTRPEDTLDRLVAKQARQEDLCGLTLQEGDQLLSAWLADASRTLQKSQKEVVLEKFDQSQGAPLYLKLAFEEARLWTSYQPQEELTVGVSGIIQDNMINRLMREGNHGVMLVSHALGYLAASRYGLAEDELVDLLSRDLQVYEWFFRQTYHLPSDLLQLAVEHLSEHPKLLKDMPGDSPHDLERLALGWLKQYRTPLEPVVSFLKEVLPRADGPRLPIVLWSRLSFDLAPYLTERMVDHSSLLSFYHRELGDVSKAVFLAGDNAQRYHEKLTGYFRLKADPARNRSWTGKNIHSLSELPYHLTEAGKFEELYETLTDFKFLEHKAEEVGITKREDESGRLQITSDGVHQLQQDFERALEASPGISAAGESRRAPLIITARKTDAGLTVYCPICNKTSPIKDEMRGKLITCPQEGCNTSLKVNPFVVEMR